MALPVDDGGEAASFAYRRSIDLNNSTDKKIR